MKAGERDIILIIASVVIAIIIAPSILGLAKEVINILLIIALAYIFFIILRGLIK